MSNIPITVIGGYAARQGLQTTIASSTTPILWDDLTNILWDTGTNIEWEYSTTYYPDTEVSAEVPVTIFGGSS